MDFSNFFPLRPGRVVVFSFPFLGMENVPYPRIGHFPTLERGKNALENGKLIPVTRVFLSSLKAEKFYKHPRNPQFFLQCSELGQLSRHVKERPEVTHTQVQRWAAKRGR